MNRLKCFVDDLLNIEPNVGGNLIVAGACRMELARHVADRLVQPALDVHVNVFELLAPRERIRLNLLAYPFESLDETRRLVVSNDPLAGQHPGVSNRSCYVLAVQPPVVVQ